MLSFRCQCRMVGVGALLVTALVPSQSEAHHYLMSPPAMYEQNSTGDPQKVGPCGDDGTATPTGMVTTYQAGETIDIVIDETIYHPGHYRVAIAVNDPSELPAEPPVTPVGMDPCGSTEIDPAPTFPVLLDGALVHDSPFSESQTIQVTLPDDLSCTSCTLQVLQYMSSHGAPCFYHHCATIAVEGAAADTSSTSGDEAGSTSMPPGSSSDAPGSSTTEPQDESSETTPDETTNNASAGEESGGSAAVTTTPTQENEDEGCGCTHRQNDGSMLALFLGVLGIAGLRTRRRRA